MSDVTDAPTVASNGRLTWEGAQELGSRSTTSPTLLQEETGGVLRLAEGSVLDLGDVDFEVRDDETMIINMGPQHPSTHGVLRLMLELQGENILRSKPVVGYLHTGMEKTAEELMYIQGSTNVTRMDYLSPFFNELAFCLAVEKLLEVEMPARATWIRMLMCELNRITSHLVSVATMGAELGATTVMIVGFRERELILSFFEKVTGLRMNHNYFRPGGVAADLPDGWRDDVTAICDTMDRRLDQYNTFVAQQPLFHQRLSGVGAITSDEAIALGASGPILRSTGVPADLRRDQPYLSYESVEFDVIVGSTGDCWDRFLIRLNEIRESVHIARQILDLMPTGDYRVQDRKVTPPPRSRIDESMDALIHHFKLFTEGFRVPVGETYVPIESPRGELGCYLVSEGANKPYRLHIRAPSFTNLQALPPMLRGGLIADAVPVIASIDPVMGDVDR
jgi:NADH-quinone oxidoreductase subunit D